MTDTPKRTNADPPAKPGRSCGQSGPTLSELQHELEQFDLEAEDRRRFRTEMKDLREGLCERRLRERIGPFLVRVEKFATQFIRAPGDAALGRSLFTPWISHLVGSAAEPEWRIVGGFDVLQGWCWNRYCAAEQRLTQDDASPPAADERWAAGTR